MAPFKLQKLKPAAESKSMLDDEETSDEKSTNQEENVSNENAAKSVKKTNAKVRTGETDDEIAEDEAIWPPNTSEEQGASGDGSLRIKSRAPTPNISPSKIQKSANEDELPENGTTIIEETLRADETEKPAKKGFGFKPSLTLASKASPQVGNKNSPIVSKQVKGNMQGASEANDHKKSKKNSKSEDSEQSKRSKKAPKDPNAPPKAKTAWMLFCDANRAEMRKENPDLKMPELSTKLSEKWKELSAEDKLPFEENARKEGEAYREAKKQYDEQNEGKTQGPVPVAADQSKKKVLTLASKANKPPSLPSIQAKSVDSSMDDDELPKKSSKTSASDNEALSDCEEEKVDEKASKPKDKKKSSSTDKKQRKKKETKDPNAPSKGKTAWMLFCDSKRDEVKQEDPQLKMTQIMSKLAEMWKTISTEEKEPFENEAKKQAEEYREAKKQYEEKCESMNIDDKDQGDSENEITESAKPGKKIPASTKKTGSTHSDGQTKKKSAWMLFCDAKRPEIRKENPDINFSEISSQLSVQWKALSPEEKREYEMQVENEVSRSETKECAKNAVSDPDVVSDKVASKSRTKKSQACPRRKRKIGREEDVSSEDPSPESQPDADTGENESNQEEDDVDKIEPPKRKRAKVEKKQAKRDETRCSKQSSAKKSNRNGVSKEPDSTAAVFELPPPLCWKCRKEGKEKDMVFCVTCNWGYHKKICLYDPVDSIDEDSWQCQNCLATPCQICKKTDREDAMLLCDGCDRGYHLGTCLSIEKAPEGEWLCPQCAPTNCKHCGKADKEESLLLCNGCDSGYHMDTCLDPPLASVPEGDWFCPQCNDSMDTTDSKCKTVQKKETKSQDLCDEGGDTSSSQKKKESKSQDPCDEGGDTSSSEQKKETKSQDRCDGGDISSSEQKKETESQNPCDEGGDTSSSQQKKETKSQDPCDEGGDTSSS